ncbi:hypothetical protein [Fredinandcohnia sp. 179-A 10B2 NHS]|uniref:hypothetical protein n=1 Tax=Fredinandcohnia sp. 179-A 10B2 NHS TaxID=3235176 RepID=UPI0039A0C03D
MILLLTVTLSAVAFLIFYRYFPVLGIQCKDITNLQDTNLIVVDVRDYNISYKNPCKSAINIPVAYLERFYNEIPEKRIHIIASTQLEKNVAIRILRRKRFIVTGYTLTEYCCKKATDFAV